MRLSLGRSGVFAGTGAYFLAGALAAAIVAGCGSATLKPGAGGADGGGGSAGVVGTGGAPAGTGGATGAGGAATDAGTSPDVPAGDTGAGSPDALPTCTGTICTVAFGSDGTWPAYDGDPTVMPAARNLGFAQPVCLNATSPPSCPGGALLYGVVGAGWSFSLTSIPGARWIWSPGIAANDLSDLRKVYFSRSFSLGLAPAGQISIGADDAARVVVNGTDVGGVGSVSDISLASMANSSLTTIDLSVALHPGTNTITIAAQNGPVSFAGCAAPCTYQMNPAGVVFGGTLSYH